MQKVNEPETVEQWLARGNKIKQLEGFVSVKPKAPLPEPKPKKDGNKKPQQAKAKICRHTWQT